MHKEIYTGCPIKKLTVTPKRKGPFLLGVLVSKTVWIFFWTPCTKIYYKFIKNIDISSTPCFLWLDGCKLELSVRSVLETPVTSEVCVRLWVSESRAPGPESEPEPASVRWNEEESVTQNMASVKWNVTIWIIL